jgi:DNA-binding response OmpR family regulator
MCAHIVLAEDDEKQAELVRRYLERERHTVVVVGDGRPSTPSGPAGPTCWCWT